MQSTAISDRKGITLIEAIVAGVLSIFTILTATALFRVNSDQIRGSFVRCKTGMQYQTVIDQIESQARQAKLILTSNDANFSETNPTVQATDVIYFIGNSGAVLGGYRRSGYIFEELKGSFTPFKVGSDTVHVVNVGANNTFSIAGDRKTVQLNLSVFGIDRSIKDTMVSKRETFVCRN